MTNLTLREEVDDGIAVLTLNRPDSKNSLSIALRNEVTDYLSELAQSDRLKVLVLTGAGDTFSAGFDLKEFRGIADRSHSDRLWASSDRFHRAVLEFPLPIIAAVNGPALAGGFDLAAMCDLRVASTTACFAHPEARFGEVAYGLLHDLIGGALARELCLLGRTVDAAEALSMRLVTAVTQPETLLPDSLTLARDLASSPTATLRSTRRKILARSGNAIRGTLDL